MQAPCSGAAQTSAHSRLTGCERSTGSSAGAPAGSCSRSKSAKTKALSAPRELAPAVLALAVVALALEGADQERPLGPGGALVLDRAGERGQVSLADRHRLQVGTALAQLREEGRDNGGCGAGALDRDRQLDPPLALGDDAKQPRDVVGRVAAVAARLALRLREAVAALPGAQRRFTEAGGADDVADAECGFLFNSGHEVQVYLDRKTDTHVVSNQSPRRQRMSTIEESIEVKAPLRNVYDQWTQFEEFPRFMDGVEEIRQIDDTHLHWVAEFGGSRHEWEAEITEQKPDERVAWRNVEGKENAGVVTFHRIDDATTRVMVQMDFVPEGIKERIGDALGAADRRVHGDLERFKELVENNGADGGWRGEVKRPDES
jgi:uncharacterized membrane protein